MIIPTPEFDPFFADDGIPFQQRMLAYIHREFGDLLGRELKPVEQFSMDQTITPPVASEIRQKSTERTAA
ncbi:hypothetical protein [Planctomicrobium piriforme]|uniref:Uncharacterized protein n=1 Tax=Planctomicrobium piriforme TaxID=1576369 RepID=A0A1I3QI25_9PLAN|nr:hypothetical protein [Planctomicrobium piriforme]SFJ33824.1 hypothetical protein SAMN05421753_118108 [Planctomicrobium piriforme]